MAHSLSLFAFCSRIPLSLSLSFLISLSLFLYRWLLYLTFDNPSPHVRFCEDQWKERGVGEIKILRRGDRKRVVMRRDLVLNICANHYITEDMTLTPAMGSDKAWVWFTSADMANEVREAVSFTVFLCV